MTCILGIDTSGRTGSVGLLGAVPAEERFEKGMIHGVAVAPAVERLLAGADIAATLTGFPFTTNTAGETCVAPSQRGARNCTSCETQPLPDGSASRPS